MGEGRGWWLASGVWITAAELGHALLRTTGRGEQSGMTCTDASTGHFFRVSRDSYQLG